MKTMKLITGVVLMLAAAAAAPAAYAQARGPREGPFVALAVGEAQYDYDCYYFSDCDTARATPVKLGAGYRFGGVFGLETWYTDFGGGTIRYPGPAGNSIRVKSVGVFGVWHLQFGPSVQGLLRAGGAQVTQTRGDDLRHRSFEGAFGLGLLVDVAPAVALELAWDLTSTSGTNTGSTLVNAATAGLRVRF